MICDKCGYNWEYGGDLKRATCPSCGKKVEVKTEVNQNDLLPNKSD